MVERQAAADGWDTAALRDSLGVAPTETEDIAYGVGSRFVPESNPVSLELFPESAVVRILVPGVQVTLREVAAPEMTADGLTFTTMSDVAYRAHLTTDGELTLTAADRDFSAERTRQFGNETEIVNTNTMMTDTMTDMIIDVLTTVDLDAGVAAGPIRAPETAEQKRERITLFGRAGAAPTMRTTASGRLIARFPMGIRVEEDETRWETIVAFGSKAEQVRDTVTKGQAVEVIGYEHHREVPGGVGGKSCRLLGHDNVRLPTPPARRAPRPRGWEATFSPLTSRPQDQGGSADALEPELLPETLASEQEISSVQRRFAACFEQNCATFPGWVFFFLSMDSVRILGVAETQSTARRDGPDRRLLK